jgi:hypothetical protein
VRDVSGNLQGALAHAERKRRAIGKYHDVIRNAPHRQLVPRDGPPALARACWSLTRRGYQNLEVTSWSRGVKETEGNVTLRPV